jgi:hypothetical protein
MTETTADIIAGQIEKFDALREEFLDGNARLFLLKRAKNSENFAVIAEVAAGWYVRWNEYRQQLRIAVAAVEAEFADYAAQSSFVAYGVPDADSQIDVYQTDDDRRDKVPPEGGSPYWKFYVLRVKEERFTVPE